MTEAQSAQAERNLFHEVAGSGDWTTVNLAEGFPGVPTPLSWSVLGRLSELAARGAFARLGALRRSETSVPASVSDRLFRVAAGRPCANLGLFRMIADRIPGTSGAALEEQIFGRKLSVNAGPKPAKRWRVIGMAPYAIASARREIRAASEESDRWWQANCASAEGSLDEEVRRFDEATGRMQATFTAHTICSMMAQGAFEQTRRLLAPTGFAGTESVLLAAADVAEARTAADLWAVSTGELSLEAFVTRHGFHAPNDGELASRSWREHTEPLVDLIESYRKLGPGGAPGNRAEHRARAARRVLEDPALTRSWRRPLLRVLLAAGREFIGLRESGRVSFLRYLDGARLAARRIGHRLEADGHLERAEDVFYLTRAELTALPTDVRAEVGLRAKSRQRCTELTIPEYWTGEPDAIEATKATPATSLQGIGASAGVVEGPARIVLDPCAGVELEPGEILVCHTTDPSWASYFLVAAGLVIDIGGMLSHGAIVARDVGLPCVINARGATESLRTGDWVRVDGTTGRVEVLQPVDGGIAPAE